MKLFVVDASVAAKWCLPAKSEALTRQAARLFDQYATGEIRFVVPDLFWVELANVFWKAVRQGRMARKPAGQALILLAGQRIPTVPAIQLLEAAFGIATAFNRTVYDSLYLALAVDSNAELITADERLANALAAHLPVKWLGSL